MSGESFFSRWSKRKHEVARGDTPAEPVGPEEPSTLPVASTPEPVASPAEPSPPAPLPDVASLTPESDFTPFLRADVDPATKAQALKTLFGDPRFNVMDGLDVYIDDYSKADPLPEGWIEKLEQVKHLGIFREEEKPAGPIEQTAEKTPEEPPRIEPLPPEPTPEPSRMQEPSMPVEVAGNPGPVRE